MPATTISQSILVNQGLGAWGGAAAAGDEAMTDVVGSFKRLIVDSGLSSSDSNLSAIFSSFTSPLDLATYFINAKYAELGSGEGVMGRPISAVATTADPAGYARDFQNGAICWHPLLGAHELHGPIRVRWGELGALQGFLGFPASDIMPGNDIRAEGAFAHFQRGSIYWAPLPLPSLADVQAVSTGIARNGESSAGAFVTYGAIRMKYLALGAEASILGYPRTDELGTPDGFGRFNQFQGGVIYWTPDIGAHEVHGLIRNLWANSGAERNPQLGYPLSDELIPDARIGHRRPEARRKPVPALPQDVIKLPAEAASAGFPASVVNLPLSARAGQRSLNRFADFENGVLYWFRGSTEATVLAPLTSASDGTSLSFSGADIAAIAIDKIGRSTFELPNAQVSAITCAGTTGYMFDEIQVHNRRHRIQLILRGIETEWPIPRPNPVTATVEAQVEVWFDPFQRQIALTPVAWTVTQASTGSYRAAIEQSLHARLDPLLWSSYGLLTLPDTDAGAPLAVLSLKTLDNGAVAVFVEPDQASAVSSILDLANAVPPAVLRVTRPN